MKKIVLRLCGSLAAVLGLWMLVWLPLVLGPSSAAEPEEHALGDPEAPVTIIEYSSLTCPHCARFHTEVLPELKERYIETGQVRMIYRDFPLDKRALDAAAIAHCAGTERYFGFIDVLFQTQANWARADDHVDALKRLGKLGGMSDAQMSDCLADQELSDGILRSRLDAQNEYEVGSTPTFIIDGKAYPGALGVDEFGALIEPLLGKS